MKSELKKKRKISVFDIILHSFFILMCLCYILPLMLVVSASFTSEEVLTSASGFSLFPREFTLEAYISAWGNGDAMIRAYGVTAAQAFIGTFLSCIVAGMIAYAISRSNFRFRGIITGIVFFTMLFSAGMIPTYIVYSKYYGLNDNFLVYILPGIAGGAWNTMVYRTFFKGLPESLFESARLDGARELTIFYKIVVPLSTPVFASIGFMTLVSKWNNYATSMIYIRDDKLYTLQYLLQRLMKEAEFLNQLANNPDISLDPSMIGELPAESLKYAMCVIAAGPMLFAFPFFQKYFSRGLTIGAIKG